MTLRTFVKRIKKGEWLSYRAGANPKDLDPSWSVGTDLQTVESVGLDLNENVASIGIISWQ